MPPQSQEPEMFMLEKLIEKQVENKVINGDLLGDREGESGPQFCRLDIRITLL